MSSASLQAQTLRNSPHEWHVLSGGAGPTILFLHGAGANAASFRALMERLTGSYQVIAPDLPGHGGTRQGARNRSGLEAMAEDIASLVSQRFQAPLLIVGHSAGAAIALRLSKLLSPRGLVLINPALDPFDGVAGWAFPVMARGLSVAPFSGDLLAGLFGRERRIVELLNATGSAVTPEMTSRYLKLAQNPHHIRGTLAMMAAWDVSGLRAGLADYACATTVVVARSDRTILPDAQETAVQKLPNAALVHLEGGHLVHEEAPERLAKVILKAAAKTGENSA
ncbi:MAG: alpha/beta fold hydrolase [Boseongicola sp.]|nr:alpha/beta fold hydrolase [Boseongicola sp.]